MNPITPDQHLTDPAGVAQAITALTQPDPDDTLSEAAEKSELLGNLSGGKKKKGKKGKEKKPGSFVPRGEGSGGNPPTPLPLIPGINPTPIAPSSATEPPQTVPTYSEAGVLSDHNESENEQETPPTGETSGPVAPDSDAAVFVTHQELDELSTIIDEFVKVEVGAALLPVLEQLKTMAADISAISGSNSGLVQKLSNLQIDVSKLKTSVTTVAIGSANPPTTKSPALPAASHLRKGSTTEIAVAVGPLAIVRNFLKTNPNYLANNLLRRIKLQGLMGELSISKPVPEVTKADWEETKLLERLMQ